MEMLGLEYRDVTVLGHVEFIEVGARREEKEDLVLAEDGGGKRFSSSLVRLEDKQ